MNEISHWKEVARKAEARLAEVEAERDALQNKCDELESDLAATKAFDVTALKAERDALNSHIARLLEAFKEAEVEIGTLAEGPYDLDPEFSVAIRCEAIVHSKLAKALAETPAQSLAAVRNEALEELQSKLDEVVARLREALKQAIDMLDDMARRGVISPDENEHMSYYVPTTVMQYFSQALTETPAQYKAMLEAARNDTPIEAIEKRFAIRHGHDVEPCEGCHHEARDAVNALQGAGYVIVPVEMTEEIYMAMCDADDCEWEGDASPDQYYARLYKAMLEAARNE